MSANELRKAAKVLREKAEKVITGDGPTRSAEWFADPVFGSSRWDVVAQGEGTVIAQSLHRNQATWFATMHPGVGLALADWLDEVAGWREEGLGLMPATNLADAWSQIERQARTVARLIVGGVA